MRSKEDKVLELFFNTPKHWHFNELTKKSGLSRDRSNYWLKKFIKKDLIKRIKLQGKMPYYVGQTKNPGFQNRKRMYALKLLNESGLLNHLAILEDAKVVILFGSFSRWDWYDHSDIDIFIYGSDEHFEKRKYELKLHREIQVHTAKNPKDLKRIDKMIQHILSGDIIKGSIQDLGVKIEAQAR